MKKPFAITLDVGSSLANKTGSWRTERPMYVDRLPPCNASCPSGENIQRWLFLAEEGDYEGAWREIMVNNPLPAIMGRVCYHPCEGGCNRAQLDHPVGIHAVERFLGDEAIRRGWRVEVGSPPTGKRVLIVGAGPSGLSCAYHLARMGHGVTILEAGPMAGGMMRFAIPKYRLPREIVDAEIQRIVEMGVEIRLNQKVTDLEATRREGGYDAVFLAVGAHIAKRAYLPAGDATKILDALSLLREAERGEQVLLGRRVLIYGGGNTALDAARSAKRLGAAETIVVYRRTRERMPAHDEEVREALDEGVMFRWLTTIKGEQGGSFQVEKMALDGEGRPQPTGEFDTIEADALVLALGQDVDLSFLGSVPGLAVEDGVVRVGRDMMTGCRGVFAGGDMVPAERTVTVAVGHGKKAARNIDAFLSDTTYTAPEKHELATFDRINTWYYADAPRTMQVTLERARRESTFEEVVQGLEESNALFEARRCLSCGNCFECDNCFGVCPDNAISKLGRHNRYGINYDYCKGCGLCAAECPCGAIRMEPEST
ncbi:MAG: NAD(P)-binding protein [Phycisphaerales bacterium]|nr:NAD(P)-binding protein [Phycisphaerales bacterium]